MNMNSNKSNTAASVYTAVIVTLLAGACGEGMVDRANEEKAPDERTILSTVPKEDPLSPDPMKLDPFVQPIAPFSSAFLCACRDANSQYWTGLTRDRNTCNELCPAPMGGGWSVLEKYSRNIMTEINFPSVVSETKYFCSCRKPRDADGKVGRWSGLKASKAACYKACPQKHPMDWAVLERYSGKVVSGVAEELPGILDQYLCACRKPTSSGYRYFSGLVDNKAVCYKTCKLSHPMDWEPVDRWSGTMVTY